MTDSIDRQTRSRVMSRIRGRHTRPEMTVRSALHRRGFRFSLHRRDLPGTPDLVLPAYDTAIFVHGCFWHWHDCDYFRLPKSNTKFWQKKLGGNRDRDALHVAALRDSGWYVAIIWECALRDQTADAIAECMDRLAAWLRRPTHRQKVYCIQPKRMP